MNEADDKPLGERDLFVNRELSLLGFQQRVLEEALDKTNPLLERVRFLAIVGANLDEFYMVRVGGLIMQRQTGVVDLSIEGMTPAEQLALIRRAAQKLFTQARKAWRGELLPELQAAGIHVLDYAELNEKQLGQVESYFNEVVFPVLTPLAVDPGHPFPHISNLSLNLGVFVRDDSGEERFARVKIPATLPRLVPIKRSSGGVRRDGTVPHHHFFVWLEQLIVAHIGRLFEGMQVVEAHPFRVIRNAGMEIQELEAADLLETMAQNVQERQFGQVVRLAITETMSPRMVSILTENLDLGPNDVYKVQNPLGLSGLMQLYDIDRFDLKFPVYTPRVPAPLRHDINDGEYFAAIRQGDILLHHPYDSFEPVVDLLRQAARDPQVLAIKQTLYRVGGNSPVVQALLQARREYRKQVAVLVELKARFDEESNIGWARKLEREGVHVTYGLLGLKTHSKVLLIVRQEGEGIRRYLHLGTGNYNHVTARGYEDFGLLTCDEALGADATDLFNHLTGFSAKRDFRKLLVAPLNLRQRLEELILRELEHAHRGRRAHMIFKVNSLVDPRIIQLLYDASQEGVQVDLIVRGICSLRPGVKGLSENIRVRSIVGRFLEHSRLLYFFNHGKVELYLGSADLMQRNIDRRVEVLFPVEDPYLIETVRDRILAAYLADNVKARRFLPDGGYERVIPGTNETPVAAQSWFLATEGVFTTGARPEDQG